MYIEELNFEGMNNLPRAGLCFRMAGCVIPFVKLLRHLLKVSSKTTTTFEDEQEITRIVSFLESIQSILSNFEVSQDFAYFGGHQVIKRLSLSSHEAISTVAVDMIGVILTCQDINFPMPTVVDVDTDPTPDEAPSRLPNFYSFPINYDKNKAIREAKPLGVSSKEAECAHIIIRSVPDSSHGIGQQSVGYYLWPSATMLSRYLCRSAWLIGGKSVLEIGAGVGMLGLVCARLHASAVCLTDVFQPIIDNLHINVQLNKSGSVPLCAGVPHMQKNAAIPQTCDVSIRSLDWYCIGDQTRKDALGDSQKFDIIVGSDLICSVECAYGVVDSIKNYLSIEGIAIIINPIEKHRWGVEKLLPSIRATEGLFFKCKTFWHSTCTLSDITTGRNGVEMLDESLDWLFEECVNGDPMECMAYYFILVAKKESVLQFYLGETQDIWHFGSASCVERK